MTGLDVGGVKGLGNRDQRHRAGLAAGFLLGCGDPRLDREKLLNGVTHMQIPLF